MQHSTEEDRKSWRFPTTLKGLFFLNEKKGEGKECTIINISSNGTGLEFYTAEKIGVHSKVFLEIFLPDEEETFAVEGIIKWVKCGKMDCACGIELRVKMNEVIKAKLGV